MQENVQQAEKIYFKSGKLEDAYKQAILKITGGDVYTKLVADLVFHFAKSPHNANRNGFDQSSIKLGELFYNNLKTYNKNLFPVPGNFNDYNQEHNDYHVLNLFAMLQERTYMIKQWDKLPGIAKRNLKLQVPTSYVSGLEYWYHAEGEKLKQLVDFLENLPNPDKFNDSDDKVKKQKLRDTVLNKIFNSKTNLDSSLEIAKHFAYAYNGNDEDISQQDVLDMLEYVNAEVLQNSNDVMVIRVQDQEAMQRLGCISTWCFARPGGESWWSDYASNGFAYVIFDFKRDPSDALFLMVIIPDTFEIYASTNVPLSDVGIEDGGDYLKQIGVDFSIIYNDSYEGESQHYNDDEDEITVRKMQPKPKQQVTNPNQLSLDFPEPELRQVAELRKRIRSALRENVVTGKNPFTKYQLSSAEYEDAVKHINNVLKYGRTNFIFSEFDTHKYYKHKPTLNAIFDYLALNYHTQKKIAKNNIYTFLFANLIPTNKSGELNAIGKTLYSILRNHVPTGQVQTKDEEQLQEDYPGEDLDSLRSIYYNPESGFNKALNNYHHQNSSFLSFLLTVLSQNMIDNYRRKSFQSDGVRTAFKTYSLDEPINFNQYAGNRTTGEKRAKPDYNSFGGSSQIKFIDALASQPNEEDDDDIFKDIDITKLRRAVIDFILTKLSEKNKTTMIQLFRQMYVLGIKDIDKLSKVLKISPVNIRVTKNRLEAFITNYVKSGEFQKYLKQKTGKHLDFPNNEFKTNKSYLSEGDTHYYW